MNTTEQAEFLDKIIHELDSDPDTSPQDKQLLKSASEFLKPLIKGEPETLYAGYQNGYYYVRINATERFFGPSGLGTPDDIEMFVRNESGIRAFPDDKVVLSRGMHRERVGPDGEIVGEPSDEVPLRALYREWKRLMG